MVVQTRGQRWTGDYWAHRAAVLELSHHPWNPHHPFTGSNVADPSLSPYHPGARVAAGLAPRPTEVLSAAALVNLVLFLIGLRRFVRRISKVPTAPFWTLLATLFLWGAVTLAVEWLSQRQLHRLRPALSLNVRHRVAALRLARPDRLL